VRTIVVTGAGTGIGRAVAVRLASDGATVVCADVDAAAACDTAVIAGDGGRAEAIAIERGVEDITPEEWDRLLGVNLRGVFLCARAAIPRLRRLGGGSIVNMASVNGFWVEPDLAACSAAKAGVINLTRAIALEAGRPEEVAAVVRFLCSEESSFCTAQPFIVDGGLSAGIPATG
jgi:NAD(P)-dependent dehydrogenase (short-subunit alcohol dehydrogenase family)